MKANTLYFKKGTRLHWVSSQPGNPAAPFSAQIFLRYIVIWSSSRIKLNPLSNPLGIRGAAQQHPVLNCKVEDTRGVCNTTIGQKSTTAMVYLGGREPRLLLKFLHTRRQPCRWNWMNWSREESWCRGRLHRAARMIYYQWRLEMSQKNESSLSIWLSRGYSYFVFILWFYSF